MSVTSYRVVPSEQVDGLLAQGWELYGNPVLSAETETTYAEIYQAMVKLKPSVPFDLLRDKPKPNPTPAR